MRLDMLKKKEPDTAVVAPVVNIYEEGSDIVMALEMPGIDKETVDLNLQGNQLTVRARKKKEDLGNGFIPLWVERVPVEYYRAFELNVDIDRDKVSAGYENGILKIKMAKSAAAQPRKIAIQGPS